MAKKKQNELLHNVRLSKIIFFNVFKLVQLRKDVLLDASCLLFLCTLGFVVGLN